METYSLIPPFLSLLAGIRAKYSVMAAIANKWFGAGDLIVLSVLGPYFFKMYHTYSMFFVVHFLKATFE